MIIKGIKGFFENAKKTLQHVWEQLQRFFYARDTIIFMEKIKELFLDLIFVVRLLRLMEAIRCGNYNYIFMSVILHIIFQLCVVKFRK